MVVDIMSKMNGSSSVVKIGEYSEGHLLKRAKEIVQGKTENTQILDKTAEARIPVFENSGKSCKAKCLSSLDHLMYSLIAPLFVFRIEDWSCVGARWILRRKSNR